MVWSWSPEEDARLDYLDHAAQVLYLRVLRRNMDYGTCIVGVSARLSYPKLIEWMEVRPERGSTLPPQQYSRSRIRALLAMLERVGLIERVKEDGEVLPLVFKLVFARTESIRPNEERPDERPEKSRGTTSLKASDESLINELFLIEESNSCDSKEPVDKKSKIRKKAAMNNQKNSEERPDEQHTSGSVSVSVINNILLRARGNGGLVPEGWLPGVEIIRRIVSQFDLPPEFLKLKACEFRLQWREQNIIAENWDWYFFGACRNSVMRNDADFASAIQQRKRQQ